MPGQREQGLLAAPGTIDDRNQDDQRERTSLCRRVLPADAVQMGWHRWSAQPPPVQREIDLPRRDRIGVSGSEFDIESSREKLSMREWGTLCRGLMNSKKN